MYFVIMCILPCSLRPVIGPKEHYITDVMVVGYKKQHSNYVGYTLALLSLLPS